MLSTYPVDKSVHEMPARCCDPRRSSLLIKLLIIASIVFFFFKFSHLLFLIYFHPINSHIWRLVHFKYTRHVYIFFCQAKFQQFLIDIFN